VDTKAVTSLRWALLIGGIAGLLCAASMLLVSQGEFGHSTIGVRIAERLPSWAQWGAAPPAQVPMLVAGFLCALLLVAGRWPIKLGAALAAAWFVYVQSGFGPGSHWWRVAGETFDYTPLRIASLVSVIALVAVSVLALVIAVRATGAAHVPFAGASEVRQEGGT